MLKRILICVAVIVLIDGDIRKPAGATDQLSSFSHPGVFVGLTQLQFIKDHLHESPWKEAFEHVLPSPLAAKDYTPHPWSTVECGSYSNPNHGCDDEIRDSQAAYTQALLWILTDDITYAENVEKILNAWSSTLTGGHINSNGPLQASWSAEMFTRAGELLKSTYPGWSQQDQERFGEMLTSQFVPAMNTMFEASSGQSCNNLNWHASAVEGLMNVAVYNESPELFDEALKKWKSLVPAYIYLAADGQRPRDAFWCVRSDSQIQARWHKPVAYVEGLTQESCRDFAHTAYGLAAIINAAETARLQGIDLYGDPAILTEERLIKAMELHSAYQNKSITAALCAEYPEGSPIFISNTKGTFEVGFNHYVLREKNSLPETAAFLAGTRPTTGYFHYLWETLTHAQTGDQ